jgi:hypothetical protein
MGSSRPPLKNSRPSMGSLFMCSPIGTWAALALVLGSACLSSSEISPLNCLENHELNSELSLKLYSNFPCSCQSVGRFMIRVPATPKIRRASSNGGLKQARRVFVHRDFLCWSRAVATLSPSVPAHGTEFSFFDVAPNCTVKSPRL